MHKLSFILMTFLISLQLYNTAYCANSSAAAAAAAASATAHSAQPAAASSSSSSPAASAGGNRKARRASKQPLAPATKEKEDDHNKKALAADKKANARKKKESSLLKDAEKIQRKLNLLRGNDIAVQQKVRALAPMINSFSDLLVSTVNINDGVSHTEGSDPQTYMAAFTTAWGAIAGATVKDRQVYTSKARNAWKELITSLTPAIATTDEQKKIAATPKGKK